MAGTVLRSSQLSLCWSMCPAWCLSALCRSQRTRWTPTGLFFIRVSYN